MSTRKSDGRHMSDEDVEAADEWHWVRVGEASAKLLARLERHHKRETAPAAKQEPFKGSGSTTVSTRATNPRQEFRRHGNK